MSKTGPIVPTPAEMPASAQMFTLLSSFMVTQVLHAAADLRLADHLAGGARTADEIAALEASHPATTYRLMRACVSLGLLVHEGGGRFTVTPMGQLLRTGVDGSLHDMAMVMGSPGHWLPWGRLTDAIRKGESQAKEALGMTLFEHFAANPAEGAAFVAGLKPLNEPVLNEAPRVIDTAGVSLAVDVGGGVGDLLQRLMLANPDLRGMVLDLPAVVEAAREDMDRAGLGDRFSVLAGDFFASIPEADMYLVKFVLHDWDDAACVHILRNCRAAATPDARLLVVETVLDDDWTLDATMMDLNMLALVNGQERDLASFDALFAASGWKRTALHRMQGPYSVIELRTA
nr:methyltransferase [uncultured Actinoplanes sp.]